MSTLSTRRVARRTAAVFGFLFVLAVTAGTSRAQLTGLFAFGDSLSDRGNTYNVLGGMPDDEAIYSLVGYTASPGRYDDGRWSNGPLWVEHLGGQLGLPPLERNNGMQPLTAGTNFAFGGATTGTNNPNDLFGIIDLPKQVENFISLAGGTASSTSLYSVWAGGNDVIYYIEFGSSDTIDEHAEKMADNIQTAVTDLYNAGARHFLVPNLPPLGDKPSYVGTPNQAVANNIVAAFNPKLEQAAIDLRTQFPDLRLATWDVFTDFAQMLQDPAMFGFTNETDAAFSDAGAYPGTVVADPNQHVFWDDTHPTEDGHELLGQYAFEALIVLGIPEPGSLILVSISIATLCGWARIGRRPIKPARGT